MKVFLFAALLGVVWASLEGSEDSSELSVLETQQLAVDAFAEQLRKDGFPEYVTPQLDPQVSLYRTTVDDTGLAFNFQMNLETTLINSLFGTCPSETILLNFFIKFLLIFISQYPPLQKDLKVLSRGLVSQSFPQKLLS